MQKVWTPPVRWIFGVATLLGIFSTLQSYRLNTLTYAKGCMPIEIGRLLVLNLAYWFVPAALTFVIFRLAHRYPADARRWPRALGVHAVTALGFSVVHVACMLAVRFLMWGRFGSPEVPFASVAQRTYLTKLDWALMTYTAIAGLSYALGYYRESQERAVKSAQLEARLAEARLRTLEAELQPHLLFNTLHAISTLVHTNPDSADRMISRISDLLRITFDRAGAARIRLQEELEFLQKYLEIEQTRFQDRLRVAYEIDPDTLDADVPRLILQPLVENAIKHGVSKRTGPGSIQITARRDVDTLFLEVRDSGIGLTGGSRTRIDDGVGLSNTRARLECLYGSAHSLAFVEQQQGLAVQMRFPFSRVPPESDGAHAVRVA